jgi:hypothetical protein
MYRLFLQKTSGHPAKIVCDKKVFFAKNLSTFLKKMAHSVKYLHIAGIFTYIHITLDSGALGPYSENMCQLATSWI